MYEEKRMDDLNRDRGVMTVAGGVPKPSLPGLAQASECRTDGRARFTLVADCAEKWRSDVAEIKT